MNQKSLNKHLALSLGYLCLVFFCFEWSNADLYIQEYFYNQNTQQWLWSKQEPVLRALLYKAPKILIIIFAVTLLVGLTLFRQSALVKKHRRGMMIVLASIILIPTFVGWLKAATNTACPVYLQEFGGAIPYVKVLEAYPTGQMPATIQKCFPAGHASGGFALISLIFLFTGRREQYRALAVALTLGWLMGNYKMVIGDHFLSHTLITQGIAWFMSCLIAMVIYRFVPANAPESLANKGFAHELR